LKKEELKIMIVLPHLTCGGTERTAAELANYIAGIGGEITLLLMYKEDKFYQLHPDVRLKEPDFMKQKLGRILYIPFLLFFIRNQISNTKPDIVFALGYTAFTLFSSLGLSTKVVISLRSSPTRVRFPKNKLLNYIYKFAHYLLRKRVDGIIAQTHYANKSYTERYSCPVITIPNFLRDLKVYDQKRQNQIITVGHCSWEKGQHYLLEAFSKLRAPGWELVIVGDGPKRKELEELSRKLKIASNVIFTGYQQDVDYYLSQSKIFAFTSVIEGYPNALIEAMATPLPPVSFDCEAGPSEIITNGVNGFLVKTGDTDGLAQKIQQLIDDQELREGIEKNAYKIKENNKLEQIAGQYLDFLRNIAQS
jgi:GalNAc-alpha-(1->4)-GalNAc-alpha-(1->3)-diNAcBac-PP-undecaprenol alpha-1,4-N-acetyl-D-galactosaminyltransferase